jgi:hypothetical protein
MNNVSTEIDRGDNTPQKAEGASAGRMRLEPNLEPNNEISELPFNFPLALAAVCHPQAILTYSPRAILHACAVHPQRIGIAESAVALAKDRSRSLPGRAMAMSV